MADSTVFIDRSTETLDQQVSDTLSPPTFEKVRPKKRAPAWLHILKIFWKTLNRGTAPTDRSRARKQAHTPASPLAKALKRLEGLPGYNAARSNQAPLGSFGGRPLIGEDSPINGGVYMSAPTREAVVVDDSYGALRKIYDDLVMRCARSIGAAPREDALLAEIIKVTQEKLRFHNEGQLRAAVHHGHLQPDRKVALDIFVKLQTGTTRHQVLLAAYLIERCCLRQLLQGKTFVNYLEEGGRCSEHLVFQSASGNAFLFSPDNCEPNSRRQMIQ
jgi:hypothetical protein